jgi:hypothetical protein
LAPYQAGELFGRTHQEIATSETQAMLKDRNSAKLHEAPHCVLCPMILLDMNGVVAHTEFQNLREVGKVLG